MHQLRTQILNIYSVIDECELFNKLAIDPAKKELFAALAKQLRATVEDFEKKILELRNSE